MQADVTQNDEVNLSGESPSNNNPNSQLQEQDVQLSFQAINPLSNLDAFKRATVFAASVSLTTVVSTSGDFITMIMLANVDKAHLSASNLITSAQSFIINTPVVTLYAIASVTGRAYGSKNYEKINPILKNGLLLGGLISLPSTILACTSNYIFKGLGEPSDLSEIAHSYFKAYSYGIPAFLLLIAEERVALGISKSFPVNVVTFINAGLKVSLGYVLIFGKLNAPVLGANGLGHAVSISNWLSLIGFTLYLKFSSHYKDFSLEFSKGWFENPGVFKELIKIGSPIAIQMGCELFGLMASTLMVGALMGKSALAARQISMQYTLLSVIPAYSINQACSILTGQARGRDDLLSAKKLGYACIVLGAGVSILALGIYSSLPKILASPFIDVEDPDNEEILNTTRYLLIINGVGQVFDSIRIISGGALQGRFTDTVFAMKAGIASTCFLAVPTGYALGIPAKLGVIGVSIARSSSLLLASGAVFIRWCTKNTSSVNSSVAGQEPTNNLPALLFSSGVKQQQAPTIQGSSALLETLASDNQNDSERLAPLLFSSKSVVDGQKIDRDPNYSEPLLLHNRPPQNEKWYPSKCTLM